MSSLLVTKLSSAAPPAEPAEPAAPSAPAAAAADPRPPSRTSLPPLALLLACAALALIHYSGSDETRHSSPVPWSGRNIYRGRCCGRRAATAAGKRAPRRIQTILPSASPSVAPQDGAASASQMGRAGQERGRQGQGIPMTSLPNAPPRPDPAGQSRCLPAAYDRHCARPPNLATTPSKPSIDSCTKSRRRRRSARTRRRLRRR